MKYGAARRLLRSRISYRVPERGLNQILRRSLFCAASERGPASLQNTVMYYLRERPALLLLLPLLPCSSLTVGVVPVGCENKHQPQ